MTPDPPNTPGFFLRLLLRIPALRLLAEENRRLRESLATSQAQAARLQEQAAALDQRPQPLSAPVAGQFTKQLHVPPGHYYSPIVDPDDDWVRRAMDREANPQASPAEFGMDENELLRWFGKIAAHYPAQPFPEQPAPGRRYHYANDAFPLADALALLGFLAEFRSRRYIEVGAGYSSCAAIDINDLYLGGALQMAFIEPHPETALALFGDDPRYRASLLPQRLQDTPLSLFTDLDAGDVLFIDSSHVGKTGSDVLDYLFRILPRLRPGVLVHLHDIFYPFEYPKLWIVDQNRSWNEAYFIRAFLCSNPNFRLLYLSDWIYKCRRHLLETRMPLCVQHRGGSLWLQAV